MGTLLENYGFLLSQRDSFLDPIIIKLNKTSLLPTVVTISCVLTIFYLSKCVVTPRKKHHLNGNNIELGIHLIQI